MIIPALFQALAVLGAAQSEPSRFIFSFGDSYSQTYFNAFDTAALPSVENPTGNPAYPGITTCNGPNWVDVLTTQLSPAGTVNWNLAAGGAVTDNNITMTSSPQIPDFRDQVAQWAETVGPRNETYSQWTAENSAFIVWFGINDVQYLHDGPFTADQNSYVADLQTLYDAGARRMLLTLVPPFKRSPLYMQNPSIAAAVGNGINDWNSMLKSTAGSFVQQHGDLNLTFYDPTATMNKILDDPTAYGAPNNYCNNTDGTSCLWWDVFHPAQQVQKAFAEDLFAVVSSQGFYE